MSNPAADQPNAPFDQRGQTVHGGQTNIAGDLIGRDKIVLHYDDGPETLPAFTSADLATYLHNVIRQCATLDLQATGGPVSKLPLERVYVALKADRASAAERRANRRQLQDDLAALETTLDFTELDERARLKRMRAFIAGHDPIGLTLVMQQRQPTATPATEIDAGALVATERWAVLLGAPGSGKTTLVRWLALRFAQAMLAGQPQVIVAADEVRTALAADTEQSPPVTPILLGPARLPVLLRLADYEQARWTRDSHDTGLTLERYLGRQHWLGQPLHPDPLISRAIVIAAVQQGQALLLFDGLDEITNRARRATVAADVEYFVRQWVRDPVGQHCPLDPGANEWPLPANSSPESTGGNQLLLTSRPIGYYQAPLAATLAHYSVAEMSLDSIRAFCRAWAGAIHAALGAGDPAADSERLAATLLDPARPGLGEIAANPLLLTILAGLYYTLAGALPTHRAALYDEVVKAFQRQRGAQWQASGLTEEAFRYAMGYVAVQLHANDAYPNALVEEEALETWLEGALEAYEGAYTPKLRAQAALLLAQARQVSGFLLERGDGVYGFIHRTFQEYFAALYLAWDRRTVTTAVLARMDEPAWREVLLLVAAQLGHEHRPQALVHLLTAVLELPDPIGGVIPRHAFFVAAALAEIAPLPALAGMVAETYDQLRFAYQAWVSPVSRETRANENLRKAIEMAVQRLYGLPGLAAVLAADLTHPESLRRLTTVKLLLETKWHDPALVAPLIAAARDYAEPVAALREALLRHHKVEPAAFEENLLPMRRVLRRPGLRSWITQQPIWLAVLQTLYLDPEQDANPELRPDAIIFDSALTDLLARGLAAGWNDKQLAEALADTVERDIGAMHGEGYTRDLAVALAIVSPEPLQFPEVRKHAPTLLHLLAWRGRTFDRGRDLGLACARARDLAFALARDLAFALSYDLDPDRAQAHDLAFALAYDLDPDRDHDRVDTTINELAVLIPKLHAWLGKYEALPALTALNAQLAKIAHWLRDRHNDLGQKLIITVNRIAAALADQDAAHDLNQLGLSSVQELTSTALESSSSQDQVTLMATARHWLTAADPTTQGCGALLLAKLGVLPAENVLHLATLLTTEDDLWRYRARLVLDETCTNRQLSRATLEALAAQTLQTSVKSSVSEYYLVNTYCEWALHAVKYDAPDWLRLWGNFVAEYNGATASVEDTHTISLYRTLLSSVHWLTANCWPVWLDLLQFDSPRRLESLLESTSWLLRLDQVPKTMISSLSNRLLELATGPAPANMWALMALGYLHQPTAVVVQSLLASTTLDASPAALWISLARLANHLRDGAQLRAIDQALYQVPHHPSTNAGLARHLVNSQHLFAPASVLNALAKRGLTPAAQLNALLTAGTDDDVWNEYHERVSQSITVLVTHQDDLFDMLLNALRQTPTDDWLRARIIIAALAGCAQIAPAIFNIGTVAMPSLLLQATRNGGSFNARRFAITALSYLRVITPEVLEAILRLATDIEVVREDVLAAVKRFNRLDPSFGEALPQSLVDALVGPSSVRAYTAVQVLATLGTAPAADVTPGVRRQIVLALAHALQDERSKRPVWLLKGKEIVQEGMLDQHIYRALLQVEGFG